MLYPTELRARAAIVRYAGAPKGSAPATVPLHLETVSQRDATRIGDHAGTRHARVPYAHPMRLFVAGILALTATGCAARTHDAPLKPPTPPPSAWTLDRQPVPRTLDEALVALEHGLGDGTIARLRT